MKTQTIIAHIGRGSDKVKVGEKTFPKPETFAECVALSNNSEAEAVELWNAGYRIKMQAQMKKPTLTERNEKTAEFAKYSPEIQAQVLEMLKAKAAESGKE